MFKDNGEAVKHATDPLVKAAMAMIAATIDTLGSEEMLKLIELVGKGARPAVRIVAPEPGVRGPEVQLMLCHDEAGDVMLFDMQLPGNVPDGALH